jgi:hypothetical protein
MEQNTHSDITVNPEAHGYKILYTGNGTDDSN